VPSGICNGKLDYCKPELLDFDNTFLTRHSPILSFSAQSMKNDCTKSHSQGSRNSLRLLAENPIGFLTGEDIFSEQCPSAKFRQLSKEIRAEWR
jgi:hypothetical protein